MWLTNISEQEIIPEGLELKKYYEKITELSDASKEDLNKINKLLRIKDELDDKLEEIFDEKKIKTIENKIEKIEKNILDIEEALSPKALSIVLWIKSAIFDDIMSDHYWYQDMLTSMQWENTETDEEYESEEAAYKMDEEILEDNKKD